MDQHQANRLIERYNSGRISAEEKALLERCIEQGLIDLDQLDRLQELDERLDLMFAEDYSEHMTSDFRRWLGEESKKSDKGRNISIGLYGLGDRLMAAISNLRWVPAISLVLLGLTAGLAWQQWANNPRQEMAALTRELQDMRETVMLSLIEKGSTGERLKAVSIANQLEGGSHLVKTALLETLRTDENVNVRLAALEALYPYADDPQVREGLIQSIQKQESPIVLIAMAEFMVALREKRSVREFRQVLRNQPAPPEIEQKINQSMEMLL